MMLIIAARRIVAHCSFVGAGICVPVRVRDSILGVRVGVVGVDACCDDEEEEEEDADKEEQRRRRRRRRSNRSCRRSGSRREEFVLHLVCSVLFFLFVPLFLLSQVW